MDSLQKGLNTIGNCIKVKAMDILKLLTVSLVETLFSYITGKNPPRSFRLNLVCVLTRQMLNESQTKGPQWLRSQQKTLSKTTGIVRSVEFKPAGIPDVQAQWCTPRELSQIKRCIVYFHGGGYVIGSIHSHRETIARLALAAQAKVLAVDYRLAPENVFPAAHKDCIKATRFAITHMKSPGRVVLAGDSAGGALCLHTLLKLKELSEDIPAACALISPWINPNQTGGSLDTKASTDFLTAKMASIWLHYYLPDPEKVEQHLNVLSANLASLPPIYIQAGDAEILIDQIREFVKLAKSQGSEVTLDEYENMFHVFQTFGATVPEGRDALRKIGDFIKIKTCE